MTWISHATFVVSVNVGQLAHAQCPDWSTDFHLSGPDSIAPYSSGVSRLATYDDGNGPALFMTGQFDLIDTQPTTNIAYWRNGSWTPLTSPFGLFAGPMRVFDDGSGPALYVGGTWTTPSFHYGVSRWNGATWTSVGPEFTSVVRALEIFDDGGGPALYAARAGGIVRWDGVNWVLVGGGIGGYPFALTTYDDGSGPALYAAGEFSSAGGTPAASVAKWNGSSWSALGSGTNLSAYVLTVFDDGSGAKLIVGGNFFTAGGAPASRVAAWDGSAWSALGAGITSSGDVAALGVFDDGSGPTLYVGGQFTSAGGVSTPNLARWDGSQWSTPSGGVTGRIIDLHVFDEGLGPRLFAVGYITQAGDTPANHIARWDGTAWSALTPSTTTNGVIYAFETWDDGGGSALYVGGSFKAAGDRIANSVAKFDGSIWTALSGGLRSAIINDLEPYDDGSGTKLYAGGGFDDPALGTGIHYTARWDGSAWSLLPGGDVNGVVLALAVFDSGSGPQLYAGGTFTLAGSTVVRHIAKWNGTVWSNVGGGVANSLYPPVAGVHALCVADDGSGPALFLGGQFDTLGTTLSGYIGKWNGTAFSSLAGGLSGPNPSTRVTDLVAWDDGSGFGLFAAGNFLGAGSVPAVFAGKWNGSTWSTLGNGTDRETNALAVFDDGTGRGSALYVGGSFIDASGTAALHMARWDGAAWSPLSSGVDHAGSYPPVVHALASFAGDLYVGGTFDSAGGNPSSFFARWDGCGLTGELFCFGDGSGSACPCGNASSVGDRVGCLNSLNVGGALRASGIASLAHDTLNLSGAQMPDGSALYFQGTLQSAGGAGTSFGDGLRCAGGSLTRLATKTPSAGLSQYPETSDTSVSSRGGVIGAGSRTYQIRYRNAADFCTSAAFNSTNGVEITWSP